MNEAVVVALSGGQDSTLCLAWARQQWKNVFAVSFDYGQRHSTELASAARIAAAFKVKHEIIELKNVLLGDSPLVNQTVELESYDSFKQMQQVIGNRIELTFVPMRNDLFLTVLANRAVVYRATDIVIGACSDDVANYPDCRPEYLEAKAEAINLSLGRKDPDSQIRIIAPLVNLTKAEIVKFGLGVKGCYLAWADSVTSYEGGNPLAKDHASLLRAQGFLEAGIPDPLVVKWWIKGLLPLPNTPNYEVCRLNEDNITSVEDVGLLIGAAE